MIVRVGLVQFTHSQSVEENRRRLMRHAAEASDKGADIVAFSELCNSPYFCGVEDDRYFALAEPIPGPTSGMFSDFARQRGTAVILPIFERTVGGEYYNSAAVIDADGSIAGLYRKMSIPVMKNDDGVSNEKYYFRPGDLGFPVFTLESGVRVAIIICYDRHFPEAFRSVALGGAQIVFVPTASSRGRMRSMWEIELRAHAFQNLNFVVGVNRIGYDENESKRDHFGGSLVANPFGEIISTASDGEGVVLAELDLGMIEPARSKVGFLRDRRTEHYGLVSR
jgi:N-carbamoylputrescine amidase